MGLRTSKRVLALAATVASVTMCIVATAPAATSARDYWLTRMAGYVWPGPVKSVQASWAVPKIVSQKGEAHASTWIGAQVLSKSSHSPFIQVGTTEDRQVGAAASPDQYWAFWSDVTLSFHPHALFSVRPGDKVTASLSLTGGRWHVSIADAANGHRKTFTTTQETGGTFNLAEWLQEDPTSNSGRPEPYPTLSAVQMSGLAVNGRAPGYGDVYSQWMGANDQQLAPTPLTADAFRLTTATISAAGTRYMQATQREDSASVKFVTDVQHWTPSTPAATIRSQSAAFAASLRANISTLSAGTWPARAQRPLRALLAGVRSMLQTVQAAERLKPANVAAWRRRFETGPDLSRLSHPVRRALGLPEFP